LPRAIGSIAKSCEAAIGSRRCLRGEILCLVARCCGYDLLLLNGGQLGFLGRRRTSIPSDTPGYSVPDGLSESKRPDALTLIFAPFSLMRFSFSLRAFTASVF
jgi:hypothetical protein